MHSSRGSLFCCPPWWGRPPTQLFFGGYRRPPGVLTGTRLITPHGYRYWGFWVVAASSGMVTLHLNILFPDKKQQVVWAMLCNGFPWEAISRDCIDQRNIRRTDSSTLVTLAARVGKLSSASSWSFVAKELQFYCWTWSWWKARRGVMWDYAWGRLCVAADGCLKVQ